VFPQGWAVGCHGHSRRPEAAAARPRPHKLTQERRQPVGRQYRFRVRRGIRSPGIRPCDGECENPGNRTFRSVPARSYAIYAVPTVSTRCLRYLCAIYAIYALSTLPTRYLRAIYALSTSYLCTSYAIYMASMRARDATMICRRMRYLQGCRPGSLAVQPTTSMGPALGGGGRWEGAGGGRRRIVSLGGLDPYR
jgi:hypothetical protein